MGNYINYIKAYIAVLATAITTALGGWDVALQVLVVFVVIDYVTGVAAAFHRKEVSSYTGFWGVFKKILLFLPVVVATMLDRVLGQELLRNLAIWFYLANEGISILENLAESDVPIPPVIINALEQLKRRGDGVEQDGQN